MYTLDTWAQSGLTILFSLMRSGSGNSLVMAGGLHLAASSISLPTISDPATPSPRPRAAPVSAALFSLDRRSGPGNSLPSRVVASVLVSVM